MQIMNWVYLLFYCIPIGNGIQYSEIGDMALKGNILKIFSVRFYKYL